MGRVCRRSLGALIAALAMLPQPSVARRRQHWRIGEDGGLPFVDPYLPRVPAAAFRMTDEEIVEAFVDAALGMDRAGADRRFVPWRRPIRPLLLRPVATGTRQVIEDLMSWTAAAGSHSVAAPLGAPANLLLLVSDDPIDDLAGPYWLRVGRLFYADAATLRAELRETAGCFALAQRQPGVALLAARTGPPVEVLRCLARSMLAVLGLRGGLPARMPSLLSEGGVLVEPTPLDRLLVALASDEDVAEAMSEEEMRERSRRRVRALRSWCGFDALAEGVGEAVETASANPFEPTAARVLQAFSEIAVPGLGEAPRLMRWSGESPIPVHVQGLVGEAERAAIDWICRWAAAATGLDLHIARNRNEEGITFMLGPTLEGLWDQEGPAVQAYMANSRSAFDQLIHSERIRIHGGVTLLHHTVPGGSILRALALIATDAPPGIVLRRIAREMLRALGVRGEAAGVGHSLFDVTAAAFQPTALDERLVRLMYRPALAPGMARDESILFASLELRAMQFK